MAQDHFATLGAALALEQRVALVFADWGGAIRYWNSGAETLFGHDAAEAIGAGADLVIPVALRSAHAACFPRAASPFYRGSAGWDRIESLHKSGRQLEIEVFLVPVGPPGSAGGGVLALFRNPAQEGNM